MNSCPVCNESFENIDSLYIHMRRKRKNKLHAEYINLHAKNSFYEKEAISFMMDKGIQVSKQSLSEKWARWFTPQERKERGNKTIGLKNLNRIFTDEQKQRVSVGLKRAYDLGIKQPPMKGKVAHNKGVPCSVEQKSDISNTLRHKYATGQIELVNRPNSYRWGFRKDIGHYVRSSWEANICRFMNYIKVQYEYEKHRFALQNGDKITTYIPDLFLPKYNLFIEIKGRFTDYSQIKCLLFREQYPQYNYALLDRRKYFIIERRLCRKVCNWELSSKNKDLKKYLIVDFNQNKSTIDGANNER